jgi:hypothetical protein
MVEVNDTAKQEDDGLRCFGSAISEWEAYHSVT